MVFMQHYINGSDAALISGHEIYYTMDQIETHKN